MVHPQSGGKLRRLVIATIADRVVQASLNRWCGSTTDPGAEEKIRLLFGKIGKPMRAEPPVLLGDYTAPTAPGSRVGE